MSVPRLTGTGRSEAQPTGRDPLTEVGGPTHTGTLEPGSPQQKRGPSEVQYVLGKLCNQEAEW